MKNLTTYILLLLCRYYVIIVASFAAIKNGKLTNIKQIKRQLMFSM